MRSLSGATTVSPFDEREMAIVSAFAVQAAMAVNGVQLVQQLEARETRARPARSTSWRRCARSARPSARASTSTTSSTRSPSTRSSCPSTDGGSIMEYVERDRCFLVRSVYRTDPERGRASCARSGSTSTRRSSGGRPSSVARSPCRTSTRSSSDPHLQILHDAGWRSLVAVPMLREGQIVGSLIVRRKRTGDFSEETVDLLETFASQSALGAAQRAAVPRAEGAEPRARAGEPAQVGVPGEHVARAAHPAQRGARLLRGAARAHVRRHQRAPGGVPARHPRIRASTCWSCSTRSSTCRRSRPDGWSSSTPPSTCARCSRTRRRCSASAPPRTASTSGSRSSADVGPVYSDELRLKQVLLNLVTNAVKFTGDGGSVVVRAERVGPGDRHHRHRHRDRCPGDDRERIFESFQQGGAAARARRAPAWVSPCRGASSSSSAAGCGWRARSASAAPSASRCQLGAPPTTDAPTSGRPRAPARSWSSRTTGPSLDLLHGVPVRCLVEGHRGARRPDRARCGAPGPARRRAARHPAARYRRLGGAAGPEAGAGDPRHPGDRGVDRGRACSRRRARGRAATSSSRSAGTQLLEALAAVGAPVPDADSR